MDIFEAFRTLRERQDAVNKAKEELNQALTEFVEREFPNPVTMRYMGKDTKGMVKVITYEGLIVGEIHLVPFTPKLGKLAKHEIDFPSVNRFELARSKTLEELKDNIIEKLNLV